LLPVFLSQQEGDRMLWRNSNSSLPALSFADPVAASLTDTLLLVARIFLGVIFVHYGYGKLLNIAGYGASFPARGIPAWLAYVAVPIEFFGGVALILGLATRYVAILMTVFVIVATAISHRYWEFTDAARRGAQEGNFYKNLTMLGGFALLFVTGAGRFSFDGWLRKR
jgi:putative oxidoreductase